MDFAPNDDGVKHINIYSQGKTTLGRNLSNFALFPIYTIDGRFNSIEGYWYWLLVDRLEPRREFLRDYVGVAAKNLGRELGAQDWCMDTEFVFKIKEAIILKLNSNPKLLEAFINSTLPFKHYYCFGSKIITKTENNWVLEYFEELRTMFKKSKE